MSDSSIHLSAAALGFFGLTNTLLATLVVAVLLIGGSYWVTRRMALVPGAAQNAVEWAVESLYDLCSSITGDERKTRLFFPVVATFFFFIILSNYFGLLPGVGTIGFVHDEEFIPLLRSAGSDLNLTLALAATSLVLTHAYSIRELGFWGYMSHWIPLHPIMFVVGILELFSEFTKLVSLSFRLFGNIFAGETVLEVIGTQFTPFILPLPFLGLELIVGFVQALVFCLLTLASMVLLTQRHDATEAHT